MELDSEAKMMEPVAESAPSAESKGSEDTPTPQPRQIDPDDARFVCNICLDPVHDSVVTVCGHLYWYISLIYLTYSY